VQKITSVPIVLIIMRKFNSTKRFEIFQCLEENTETAEKIDIIIDQLFCEKFIPQVGA
jgi:hypothetical protein